jgi:hypothetical protein
VLLVGFNFKGTVWVSTSPQQGNPMEFLNVYIEAAFIVILTAIIGIWSLTVLWIFINRQGRKQRKRSQAVVKFLKIE